MAQQMKKIVLLGPQGSGKSTQSKVITDFLKIPLVSASHTLRKMIGRGTALGNKIKELMDQGSLVPDDQMISLILGELGSEYCLNGYLLDGFPRNIRQAQTLDSSCGVDKVFNIEISDDEAVKRMAGRRICSHGHVFHVNFKPSTKGNICDICDQELYQREDDKEEIVKKRLTIYRRDTAKLLEYYNKQNKLVSFNGEKPITQVSEDILNYLKANVG